MTLHRTLLAIAALTFAAHAGAQTFGNPAGLAPDTPNLESAKPPPDHANTQDKLFARQAAIGGRAEVDLGKLAQKKASDERVRSYGKMMVDDHSKSNGRLMKVVRAVKTENPGALDAEHQALASDLGKKSGKEFDLAYLTAQMQDHQRTANLLQYELSYGQNEPLKQYAADTLPGVLQHLELARLRYSELTAPTPR